MATLHGLRLLVEYIVQRGLKKFGQRGADAATKEMDQLAAPKKLFHAD
jgi:hypothetical protein